MSPTEFSSEGFDLDNLPRDGGDNVILELGGGQTTTTVNTPKKEEPTATASSSRNPLLDRSEEFKAKGNAEFKQGAYLEAYDMYTEAIEACGGFNGKELLTQKELHEEEMHNQALERHRQQQQEEEEERRRKNKKERGERNDDDDNNDDKPPPSKPAPPPPLPPFEAPPQEFGKELAIYHSNRAACLLHLERYDEAIDDCTIAVLLNPSYTKAWVRRSQAYENTERTEEALADAKKALECSTKNSSSSSSSATIRRTVQRLQKLEDERLEKLKEETMGKLKDLGNSILGNFGLSLDNFKAVQDPNTGSYSISFDQQGGGNKAQV